jgi:PAS domain S-box-containing protein
MNPSKQNLKSGEQSWKNVAGYDQKILNTSSIGVLITRVSDGTILYANKAIAGLLEIKDADSLIGRPTPDFYWDPRDRQAILERFRAEGFATENELRTRRPNGDMAWVSISLQPFYFEGEEALLSEVTDITARKQAELALRENQLLYQSLVEVLPFSICRKDLEGRFTFANQRFLESSHITLADLLGKTDFDLHPSELAEKYRRDDLVVMNSGKVQEIIEERIVQEGETVLVQTIKAPIYDGTGKVNGIQISFWNVTDHERAEEDILLRDRALASAVNAVIIVRLSDNKPIYLNDALLKMTGYTREEAMQLTFADIASDPEELKKIQAAVYTQGFFSGEELIKRKDGSFFPTNFYNSLIRDTKGQPMAVMSSFFDITERKQAQEALRESQQRYETIFNASPIMFWLKDAKNNMIQINQAAAAFEGVNPDDINGRSSYDVYPREQAEAFYQDDLQVIRSCKPKIGILEKHTAPGTGKTTWVETGKVPVFDNKGDVAGVLAFAVDITDRQQAEEDLRESEDRFRRFTEATVEGVVFHEQGKIVDVNPAAVTIFGYREAAELIGRNLLEFIVPDNHKMVLQKMQSETVEPYEIQGIHRDGAIFPVETSTRAYKVGDKTIRASSIRDITERKKAEESLRQSEANLSSALRVANMGHWEYDIAAEVFTLNDQYYSLHGMTAQQAGGYQISLQRFAQEFVLPEDAPIVGQATQQAIETKDPNFQVQIEARVMHKDGKPRWMAVWFRVEKDSQGRTIKLHGVNQDITERKQAEQKLQENQQLLQLVMDNIPQSVFWKDKENLSYLGVNQAFAEDAGFASAQELVGKNDFDMPWKEQAELYRADDRRVLDLGEPKLNYEEPQTGPTGQVTWLRTSKIPMRNANGQVFAVLGMYEDITEQKRLQQQVQESFERRGYQVQVSTDISQEVAAATELNELFDRVVTLTKERLGYYHTQLLRYDPVQDAVVLISGYGETGKKMLEGGHKMPMGSGLIGTAAESGQTVLRPTLADDPDWHPNPLLPDTKGEIAVPIKWQDKVLGVLDVQSDKAGALVEDDRLLLEGLCGQIAITMHSAELVETIRENEARLAEALKIARLANWEYDVEKDIFTFNDQFYSLFHTTAEQHGGYQLPSAYYAQHFVHPDDLPIVGVEIEKALTSTERHYSRDLEHRILYADGGVGHITVNINVDHDENGKITRYYGANQDITERKLAEARLAEALKAARLAHWEYDVEKDIFTFNDQFYSIFHTTAEKVGGYQLSSARYAELLVHPDDLPLVGTEIGKALSSTERVYNATLDHRILYADGGVGYITVKLTVERDENGKITRYYGANQDITEQRKAQEELAERLEEINRLYQNLSHEGWKNYRETTELPSGFVFDQTGTKPVEDDAVVVDENFASVPMKVLGGEVVGTLAVANDPRNPTSLEDIVFLQEVSDQIALALEGARLSAQTQSALAQSEKLFEASRRMAQAQDLQELVKITVEIFGIPVINGAELDMFSYNSAGELESLAVVANWWNGTGTKPGEIGLSFSKEMFSAVKMFLTPTPVFINDALHSESVDGGMQRIITSFNIRAVTFLPLFVGAHQIGVLVMHAEEPHDFTEEETRLFSGLAPQIATVLENRRQFERAQKQAERESTLNIISQKIQSATTVEAVLQIAARELGHALGAPMTVAQLSMKDKK